jgi:selenophosphate synthetase-related protein
MQIGPKAMKWQSTITKKTKNKKAIICHKSANDGGALIMMCGRNEKPQPSAIAHWKIVMICACYKAMDTWCQQWEMNIKGIKENH